MKWKPVLKNDSKIIELIKGIAFEFLHQELDYSNSLYDSDIGIDLFFFYAFQFLKKDKYNSVALQRITERNSRLDLKNSISPFTDSIGLIWLLYHLEEKKMIKLDKDDIVFIEEIILCNLTSYKYNKYDYINGYLGLSIFQFKNKVHQVKIDTLLSNKFILNIEEDEPYLIDLESSDFYRKLVCNNGVAHGIPNIIVILSYIYRRNNDFNLLSIIDKFFKLLMKSKINSEANIFPNFFDVNCFPLYENSKLGWCYGDLAIASALYVAYLNTGQLVYLNESLSIAKQLLNRSFQNSNIDETCLCHGSSGIGLMYSRFYNYTGNVDFKKASQIWYNKTLELFSVDSNLNNSLFIGKSGVGLSLISAVSEIEPSWDRCLLLS